MRIGLISWQHESNTFSSQPTTRERFREDTLLTGSAVTERYRASHHELGGMIETLERASSVECIPIIAARATPSGKVDSECYREILEQLLRLLDEAGPLDGLLVAPHGAMVSDEHADAEGYWLGEVRKRIGPSLPMVGTLDPHTNLSPAMVRACDALIAYRTNPHLDQKERGAEAANVLMATIRGELRPTMAAVFPPLAISIQRQCTEEPHWQPVREFAAAQRESGLVSNSVILGFPYADVAEMGASAIAIADGDADLAARSARDLAGRLWTERQEFDGSLLSIEEAFANCDRDAHSDDSGPVCLLDMGDNVGGGSAADSTYLLESISRSQRSGCFVCIYDPASVLAWEQACEQGQGGESLKLQVGGKSDRLHGEPIDLQVRVVRVCDGRFTETAPRHGGMTHFDQGKTAIVETTFGSTIMLTSRRMVPFSLQQLLAFDIDPARFKILIAKGVNAPIAAYRSVCSRFVRVNTPGSTCADMHQLSFNERRRPLYPLEAETQWEATAAEVVFGANVSSGK